MMVKTDKKNKCKEKKNLTINCKQTYIYKDNDNNNNNNKILLKKNPNECIEPLCQNIIFNKSRKLCEYHYRRTLKLRIQSYIPNCIYSDDCTRKIVRRFLCDFHYKKYRSKDPYTIKIVKKYLKGKS